MSTHYIDCITCGMEIGSSHEGYEEGYHPECRPFKQARVLMIDYPHNSVYRGLSLGLLEEALLEEMEVMVFDLTEPFRPFTEDSFPKGGMFE